MAVEEYKDKAGKEWTKFTGDDLPKAKGLLTEAGNEAYRKAFHENEGQYVKLSDPNGNPTEVHKRDLDQALAQGYGRTAINPSMIVPDLPWHKNHVARPGKHRYKFNRETRQMEEV